MTLVRSAHTFKWGYEGQYVNFDLIRGNGARSATFTGTRSGNAMADFMLGAFDTGEPRIRRRRQLPASLEASVLHSGRVEAHAAHHDERRSALRAVVPVGAGIRPLHLLGIRHAVDRQARCAARHSVPGRSERAVQDGRERSEQLRAAIRHRVGRQRQRQNRHPRRIRHLLQPHRRNLGARRRGAVDRHGAAVQRPHRGSVRVAQPRACRPLVCRSPASSAACRPARIQG